MIRQLCCMLLTAGFVQAQHRVLVGGCGFGEVSVYAADGSKEWSMAEKLEVSNVTLLPNNDIAMAYKAGARIIRPDWEAKSGFEVILDRKAPKGGENHTCQPLPGGGFLIGESFKGSSFIIELDSEFNETKRIELKNFGGKHQSFRQIGKTPAGTYLVTQQRKGGKALEISKDGKTLREFPDGRFTAERLKNGNTLIACGDAHRLIEVDPQNKIVWSVEQNDLEGISIGFVADFQRLENGNTVFCNWGGHGGASGGSIIEVTPEKKVVWKSSPGKANRISSIHVLD
ncbi:hypothetical protein P4B35_13800 [Pontiellaceae bacterium B12227]|nr:hypothetical protein [Pontiellaceae bacterium B12227]